MFSVWLDYLLFLKAWIRDPRRIGALAPSGRNLARKVTAQIVGQSQTVIELGPGTGVFTRALLANGVPEAKLVLVETDRAFVSLLRNRFPQAKVLHLDARDLDEFGSAGAPVSAVLSGLPFRSMTPWKRLSVLSAAFRQLSVNGTFYQFTYGLRCPIERPLLDRLGLKADRLGGVWWNFPPASVFSIRRRTRKLAAVPATWNGFHVAATDPSSHLEF